MSFTDYCKSLDRRARRGVAVLGLVLGLALVLPGTGAGQSGSISIRDAQARVSTPIPADIALGALRRFRAEVVHERDRIPGHDDQVTGGAAAIYFWPTYYATIASEIVAHGVPTTRERWEELSVRGFVAAAEYYWREQGRPGQPPTPPSEPPSSELPIWSRDEMVRVRADFLALPLEGISDPRGWSSLLFFGRWGDPRLDTWLQQHRAAAYTHVNVYVVNEHDFGGVARFDGYARPDEYEQFLRHIVRHGLRPIVWLAPDDAPTFHRSSAARLCDVWRQWIPRMRGYVAGFVVGLEMNEYWTAEQQRNLTNCVVELAGDRPVWQHWTPGRWAGLPERSSDPRSRWSGDEYTYWRAVPQAAGIFYQYDQAERRSKSAFQERTEAIGMRMVERLGRLFVGSEYAYPGDGDYEPTARERGGWCLAVRYCIGFANGGPQGRIGEIQ